MADELETILAATMWIPRGRRDSMVVALRGMGKEARSLLPFALATQSLPGVEFWYELFTSALPPPERFPDALIRHGITTAGARTVRPSLLREAYLRLKKADPKDVPAAREAFLTLGAGVSLANAHGIYVVATRKVPKALLPKESPHLGGPLPELTVFETVEVALAMARLALEKKPSDEGKQLLALAERQLAWVRAEGKKPAPASSANVPATSKAKGPGFALARAALMESLNTDHVSARGTSIKSAVMWGLELGEAWWLSALDEALMLADARAAWEKRGQQTSSPIVHLVWRGGDKTTRLWLVRLQSGSYALLAKLGRNWTTVEGDLQSVAATVPDAWFALAMPVIEQRR